MKKLNEIEKATYIISAIVMLFALFAICVGLDWISLSETSINFNF